MIMIMILFTGTITILVQIFTWSRMTLWNLLHTGNDSIQTCSNQDVLPATHIVYMGREEDALGLMDLISQNSRLHNVLDRNNNTYGIHFKMYCILSFNDTEPNVGWLPFSSHILRGFLFWKRHVILIECAIDQSLHSCKFKQYNVTLSKGKSAEDMGRETPGRH